MMQSIKALKAENIALKKELCMVKNQRDIYLKELQRKLTHSRRLYKKEAV